MGAERSYAEVELRQTENGLELPGSLARHAYGRTEDVNNEYTLRVVCYIWP